MNVVELQSTPELRSNSKENGVGLQFDENSFNYNVK